MTSLSVLPPDDNNTTFIRDLKPDVLPPEGRSTRKKHPKKITNKAVVALAALGLALGVPLVQNTTKERVHQATALQGNKTLGGYVSLSRAYYLLERPDISQFPEDKQLSMAQARARMMILSDVLNKGELSLSQFLEILRKNKEVIVDENTHIDIRHDFPVDLNKVSATENDLEFFTPDGSPNRVLEDTTVSSKVEEDALHVDLEGDESELITPNKYSVGSHVEGQLKSSGKNTYRISIQISPK